MTDIHWNEVLDIGLPELDAQHRHLISLANSLIQAMINGIGQDVLEHIFQELLDYTSYHFAEEEAYMEKIGFPSLAKHKEYHQQLTNDVHAFRDRLVKDDVTPQQALDFVNGWIVKHIVEKDGRIGLFSRLS